MVSSMRGIALGSISSGFSPESPSSTARSVPWPMPVSASDPNISLTTRSTASSCAAASISATKRRAARMGPTVCELDGPMPILNRSKTLVRIPGAGERGRYFGLYACPLQQHFTRAAGPHDVEAFFEIVVRETVRDNRFEIEPGLEHDGHFVPGFVHFAAVDALDGEHVEDHVTPVDGHLARGYAEHGDFGAVAHVFEHFAKRGRASRHLEADVESFLHTKLLLDLSERGFARIDGESSS